METIRMPKYKRCYYGKAKGGDIGYSVVAPTARLAKTLLWNSDSDIRELCDGDFCELRIKWKRDVDAEGKDYGHVYELIEGIRCGAYSGGESECPECGNEAYLALWPDGSVSCEHCWEDNNDLV